MSAPHLALPAAHVFQHAGQPRNQTYSHTSHPAELPPKPPPPLRHLPGHAPTQRPRLHQPHQHLCATPPCQTPGNPRETRGSGTVLEPATQGGHRCLRCSRPSLCALRLISPLAKASPRATPHNCAEMRWICLTGHCHTPRSPQQLQAAGLPQPAPDSPCGQRWSRPVSMRQLCAVHRPLSWRTLPLLTLRSARLSWLPPQHWRLLQQQSLHCHPAL
mmetsp:Transcript_54052/g.143897  ORF Transcript_54052/g.143897 Transcript_54052/m.143897 type:complete len:217 (-) Transcript_54052:2213-2863(-)